MTIFIGIDPGLTGAVAAINSTNGAPLLFDIPTKEVIGGGMVKRRVDGYALAKMLRTLAPVDEAAFVTCELVHAIAGMSRERQGSMQTMGSLMRTFGAVEAVLDVLRLPGIYVRPQAWKSFFALTKDKTAGREMAVRLYPGAADGLKRVKDHNRAEALLLAHYGLSKES